MRRRDFFTTLAVGGAGAAAWGIIGRDVRAEPLNPDTGSLLSTTGCSAATAHPAANKIVTVDGKTHVGWVDSDDERFQVRIRTLDRATGLWSPKYTVGDAFDNHGGPALAADSAAAIPAGPPPATSTSTSSTIGVWRAGSWITADSLDVCCLCVLSKIRS